MQAAVYQIVNTFNGIKYIGSSSKIAQRFGVHKSDLTKNIHDNIHLQNAWNKYGEAAFRFDIIQYCNSGEDALAIENELLELYDNWGQWDEIYNVAKRAMAFATGNTWNRGRKHSEEKRKNMGAPKGISSHRKGIPHSEETKRSISNKLKGKPLTEETKRKMSEAQKLRWAKKKLEETPWR